MRTKNSWVIIAATPIMNPTPSSDDTLPNTICAPCIIKRIQRNIDQIAANVALGYPPTPFCFAATIIDTMHWMRPKNWTRKIEIWDKLIWYAIMLTWAFSKLCKNIKWNYVTATVVFSPLQRTTCASMQAFPPSCTGWVSTLLTERFVSLGLSIFYGRKIDSNPPCAIHLQPSSSKMILEIWQELLVFLLLIQSTLLCLSLLPAALLSSLCCYLFRKERKNLVLNCTVGTKTFLFGKSVIKSGPRFFRWRMFLSIISVVKPFSQTSIFINN